MDEKISASLNRDGGLENMEVKGELTLRIAAADKARLKVGMKVIDVDSAIQFKVSIGAVSIPDFSFSFDC